MYTRTTAVISNPTGLCLCILKSLCVWTYVFSCVCACKWAWMCLCSIQLHGGMVNNNDRRRSTTLFPAPFCSTYCILTTPERVSTILEVCVLTSWTYEHAFVFTPGCISVYFWNYGFTSHQVACWTISRVLFPSSACPAALASTVPQTQVPFCGSTLNSFN